MITISRRQFLQSSAYGACLLSGSRILADDENATDERAANPFLGDNFAPVREEIAADNLKVSGELPQGLNGMFVRNGPNPQFPPILNYHWFEGDGMLHGVRIQDGKASYRNRWIRTAAWREANEAGEEVYPSVLDPLDKFFLERILSGRFPYPNRANTALVWHHSKLLALWEGGPPHEIKVPSLETIGPYKFGAKLKHACTAHPKVDPRTGELIFFGYSPFPPFLQYSVADRNGTIKRTTSVELPRPVMMHDIAITENHTLFLDCPMVFDLGAVVRGKPFLHFEPRHGARIGVLPRHAAGQEIRWFAIKPCFIFHIFNAHEEGSDVVLHGCRYRQYPDFASLSKPVQAEAFGQFDIDSQPVAYRWQINLDTGQVTEAALDDEICEFPRVNERLTGTKAKYGYVVGDEWNKLLKYDFDRGTRDEHRLGKGEATGEAVFVPRPDAEREDDGWLVSFTHNRLEGKSELRIVDARDMLAEPIARVQIPQRVPYGFHAIWIDATALG
jgi:carotenoid cleavage dioxygenase